MKSSSMSAYVVEPGARRRSPARSRARAATSAVCVGIPLEEQPRKTARDARLARAPSSRRAAVGRQVLRGQVVADPVVARSCRARRRSGAPSRASSSNESRPRRRRRTRSPSSRPTRRAATPKRAATVSGTLKIARCIGIAVRAEALERPQQEAPLDLRVDREVDVVDAELDQVVEVAPRRSRCGPAGASVTASGVQAVLEAGDDLPGASPCRR